MTDPGITSMAVRPSLEASRSRRSLAFFYLWLLIQLAALTLAAARVPLSARFPQPAERLAVDEMLVAQTAAAAFLFPELLGDVRSAVFAIVATWPMLRLAAALADAPRDATARAGVVLSLWLVALATWGGVLRSRRAKMLGIAIGGMTTLGAPALAYLHAEFAPDSASAVVALSQRTSPLVTALRVARGDATVGNSWTIPAAVLLSAVVTKALQIKLPRARRAPSPAAQNHATPT